MLSLIFRSAIAFVAILNSATLQASTPPDSLPATLAPFLDDNDAQQGVGAKWIGVRFTSIPEAVAAHTGKAGLMITNIATGSPADLAGLARYDILLRIEGKPLDDVEQLQTAIAETAAGKSLTVLIRRAGKELTFEITPAPRPSADAVKFKYDEPDALGDESQNYFGHTLRKDQLGQWILEPLGRLQQIPDALKDVPGPAWRQWQDQLRQFQLDPFTMQFRTDPDGMFFFEPDHADADAQTQLSITWKQDDQTVSIAREVDGQITVTRERQGKKSEVAYPDAAAFEKADPEAFRIYSRHTGLRARQLFVAPPSNLRGAQDQFRQQLEKRLRELQRESDELRRQAEAAARDAARTLQQRKWARDGVAVEQRLRIQGDERFSMSRENGRISVSVERDGQREEHEFQSMEEFRKQLPEVYRKLFPDENPDGGAGQRRSQGQLFSISARA